LRKIETGDSGLGKVAATDLAQWIRSAQKGDVDAYQKIYELFIRRILNFIYRMVNSPEEAEDLAQDTFVTAYRKLGTLKDVSKFQPWLFRIARNYVYQKYRSPHPPTVSIDARDENGRETTQLVDSRKNPDEALQTGELEKIVAGAIAELPDKYREVFVLSAIHHLRYQDIAGIVGQSLASVKTDIHRARIEVRKRIKEYLKVSSWNAKNAPTV
jgi:RNA polymerase sigma-70 factor, ECF subfamily